MSIKNLLIIVLVKMIRRLPSRKRQQCASSPHYLVVSTTALGDTLWATPALKALKSSQPQASISVLTSSIGQEVLSGSPYIDKLCILQKPHIVSLINLFYELRKHPIDKIFIFHTSQRAILPFCCLLRPKEIIATAGINKGLDALLTTALKPKYEHEIERRLRIVSQNTQANDRKLELFLFDQDRAHADFFLTKNNFSNNSLIVGLHPGAKDRFKQWPAECFIQLACNLKKKLNCSILVTGSPREKELTEKIASAIPGAIALSQSVPLKTLAALIERCDVFVTNDTGPMHVAFAMQTPVVALFTGTDSNLCGPLDAEKALAIQKQKTCSPCLRKKCKLPFCMLQISPEEVEQKVYKLLEGASL